MRGRSAGFRRAGFPSKKLLPPKKLLPLIALLGAGLGLIPAFTSSAAEPTVSAVCASECSSLYPQYAWSPMEAAVAAEGKVVFTNATPGTPHGIVWTSPAKPSCEASVPDGQSSKEFSSSSSWSGACTFASAGTYTFQCYVHPYMKGTVTVNGPTTTTGTTTGAPPPTETTTTTGTPPPPSSEGSSSPLAGSAAQALKLPKSQRGTSVRGSIAVSHAGAGSMLEVQLWTARASLARAGRHAVVQVGRLVRRSLHAGRLSFAVSLNHRARRALRRHRRLALTVKVVLTPVTGKPLTITRSVVERV